MERFLEEFTARAREKNLTTIYAQVCQNGEIKDTWSRFQVNGNDGMSAFKGISRMESYSMAKSFAGIGVGIAVDEGLIRLDEKVAESFPELTYDISDPDILDVTVEDMLKMASGMSVPMFFRDSEERAKEKDWPRYIYSHGQYGLKRGEDFLYNNVNPYLLGCLIEKKSGQNLLEYLRYRLFEPLKIHNPNMTSCPMGHTVAANGLDINCEELTRFGTMLLQGGEFNGKRIVSKEYVEAALAPQIATGKKTYWPSADESQDYGYQFWVDAANHCSYAWGILGQFCMILPEKQAVVTVQSMEKNEAELGKLIWSSIVEHL